MRNTLREPKENHKLRGDGTRHWYDEVSGVEREEAGSEETKTEMRLALQWASIKNIIALSRSFMGLFCPYLTLASADC